MKDYNHLGKLLIAFGGIIILSGILLLFVKKIPMPGKMPGDIVWKGKSWSVYFPLGTSILLSILLTLVLYLIRKFYR